MTTSDRSKLVRMGDVLDIVEAAIWTGGIFEAPVSVVLVAEQENGKTEALNYFVKTSTLHYLSDVTSRGIRNNRHKIELGTLRHFVILDLVRVLSHPKSTTEQTIQTLSGLMEEGLVEESDAGGVTAWRNSKVGVLTSVTPGIFKTKLWKWRQTGFITRFIPVNYALTQETRMKIHYSIRDGQGLPNPICAGLPVDRVHVDIADSLAQKLMAVSVDWGDQYDVSGFRHHKQIRRLAKARALSQGRTRVIGEDVDKVISWHRFFSINKPALI